MACVFCSLFWVQMFANLTSCAERLRQDGHQVFLQAPRQQVSPIILPLAVVMKLMPEILVLPRSLQRGEAFPAPGTFFFVSHGSIAACPWPAQACAEALREAWSCCASLDP